MPNGKRREYNIYAKTREECEKLLAKMIAEKKEEIAKTETGEVMGLIFSIIEAFLYII